MSTSIGAATGTSASDGVTAATAATTASGPVPPSTVVKGSKSNALHHHHSSSSSSSAPAAFTAMLGSPLAPLTPLAKLSPGHAADLMIVPGSGGRPTNLKDRFQETDSNIRGVGNGPIIGRNAHVGHSSSSSSASASGVIDAHGDEDDDEAGVDDIQRLDESGFVQVGDTFMDADHTATSSSSSSSSSGTLQVPTTAGCGDNDEDSLLVARGSPVARSVTAISARSAASISAGATAAGIGGSSGMRKAVCLMV